MSAGACIRGTFIPVWNKRRCPPSNRKRETRRLHTSKVQKAKAKVLSVVDTDETDSVIYYYHENQLQDLELKQFSNGSFLGPQRKQNTCTQRNRWRKEDCFKLDLHFVLQFKTCRIKSMTKFFLKWKLQFSTSSSLSSAQSSSLSLFCITVIVAYSFLTPYIILLFTFLIWLSLFFFSLLYFRTMKVPLV